MYLVFYVSFGGVFMVNMLCGLFMMGVNFFLFKFDLIVIMYLLVL